MSTSFRLSVAAAAMAGICTLAPSVALAQSEESSADASSSSDQSDLVARGEYLSNMAGCRHCHQARDGEPYAGGRVILTPFGRLMSPNITQHEPSGIGGWTRDDFEGALRRGVNKEGGPLYPAMPYNRYTLMSDEDIDALWAYYQTVEPVFNEVETIQLPFPYNVRQGVAVWKELYFEEARYEPREEWDDQLNRGAYLAEGVAHCAACHTTRNSIGGPVADQAYQGAVVDGWYAPNISGSVDSHLNKFDQETLTAYLANEHPDGLAAFGPMYQVADSLSKAERSDVEAISAYILKRAEDDPEGEADEVAELSEDAMARGAAIYEGNCLSCHGDDGMGRDGLAARLVNNGGVNGDNPVNVINVLLQGIEPRNDWGQMPSFYDSLSDEEIADVTNYVRASWGNEVPRLATALDVERARGVAQLDMTGDTDLTAACPVVSLEGVSDGTRDAVRAVADGPVQEGELQDAVASLENDLSDAEYTRKLTVMTSLYCDALAELDADISEADFRERQLAFMNELNNAIANDG